MNNCSTTRFRRTAILASLLLVLADRSAPAQFIRPDWTERSGISLEMVKPGLDRDRGTAFASGSAYLGFHTRISDRARFKAEIPFSHYESKRGYYRSSSSAIGDPYLGVETVSANGRVFVDVGARLPLASNEADALLIGALGDYQRIDAFARKAISVQVLPAYEFSSDDQVRVRVQGGPSLFVFTDDLEFRDDFELFALYEAQAWYEGAHVRVGIGITGRVFATEPDLNFAERSVHQATVGAQVRLGRVKPGLYLRVPVDKDLGELVDYSVGLSIAISAF